MITYLILGGFYYIFTLWLQWLLRNKPHMRSLEQNLSAKFNKVATQQTSTIFKMQSITVAIIIAVGIACILWPFLLIRCIYRLSTNFYDMAAEVK